MHNRTCLGPFSRASRRLTDLSEELDPLFEKFEKQGKVELKDQGKRELFTFLKSQMQPALSRTFFIADSDSIQKAAGNEARRAGLKELAEFDLSLSSRYLLLASYIASRNPSKVDDALFGTGDDKESRKRKRRYGLFTFKPFMFKISCINTFATLGRAIVVCIFLDQALLSRFTERILVYVSWKDPVHSNSFPLKKPCSSLGCKWPQ
jgi:hypothetical protein